MKPNYSNKYRHKYLYLNPYFKKHICTKVRKNFMSDKEFLGIYNLYRNLNTLDDFIFLINMIKTSKVYKHYKTNTVYFRSHSRQDHTCSIKEYLSRAQFSLGHFDKKYTIIWLSPIIEWLFSHTIHTNSLNSVTFK